MALFSSLAAAFTISALGTFGAVLGGIAAGALIGAAIGGLTALVTGGDIGKGLLFGAIGGAVTGGIAGYMNAGSLLGAGQVGEQIGTSQGMQTFIGANESGTFIKEGTKQVLEKTGGGLLGKIGEEGMGALIEGGIGLVGSTMQGMGEQERWEKEMEIQISEAEKNRQAEMKMLKEKLAASGGGGGGGAGSDRDWAAELAENARQFDAELAQRQEEFAKTMGIRKEELYAPMEYEKERKARAGSALASVSIRQGRADHNAGTPTIMKQIVAANTGVHDESVPNPQIPLKPQEVPAQ